MSRSLMRIDTPIFVPLFAAAFVLALAGLVGDTLEVPRLGWAAAFFVAGGPLSYYALLRSHPKALRGVTAGLRAFLTALLLSYVTLAILRSGPLTARFIPDALLIYRVSCCAVAWWINGELLRSVSERDTLVSTIFNVPAGEERRQRMRDFSQLTADLMRRLSVFRRVVSVLTLVLALGAFGSWINGTPASRTTVVFIVLAVAFRYVLVALLDAYLDEFRYSGDGNRLPTRFRRRRLRHAVTLVLLVALISAPLSGNRSVLPPEVFGAFFSYLGRLFPHMERETLPPDLPSATPGGAFEGLPGDMEMSAGQNGAPAWFAWLTELFERIAIAALLSAIALFILSPLFTAEARRMLRSGALGRLLAHWWKTVCVRFRFLFSMLSAMLGHLRRWTPQSSRTGRSPSTHGNAPQNTHARADSPDPQQQRQIDRASRLFRKVERWAAKAGMHRRNWEAPAEFALRLAGSAEHLREDLSRFSALYEELLYSNHRLSDSGWRELEARARRICHESSFIRSRMRAASS